MTTIQAIQESFTHAELSAILAEITDALQISPPCSTTKDHFRVRIAAKVRYAVNAVDVANSYQTALQRIQKF